MTKCNCLKNGFLALAAAACFAAVPCVSLAVPSVTFTYDAATIQYSTTSTFSTATTIAIVGNAVTVPLGDYFRFGVDAKVSNNPNAASGGAFDQTNSVTEPANLGLTGVGFVFNTSNNSILSPVTEGSPATALTNFPASIPFAVTGAGKVNTLTGQVGANGAYLSAGVAVMSVDPTDTATYADIDSFATQSLLFSNLVYEAEAEGSATVSAFIPPGNLAVTVLDPRYSSPQTNTNPPNYIGTTAVTSTNLPALTVNVSVPEPATATVLLMASAGLLAGRRRRRNTAFTGRNDGFCLQVNGVRDIT